EVERRDEALASVAAPRAEDGADGGIADHALEVRPPLVVVPGEVRPSLEHARAEPDFESPALQHPDTQGEAIRVHGTRGSDDGDDVSAPDPGRLADRRGRHIGPGHSGTSPASQIS